MLGKNFRHKVERYVANFLLRNLVKKNIPVLRTWTLIIIIQVIIITEVNKNLVVSKDEM